MLSTEFLFNNGNQANGAFALVISRKAALLLESPTAPREAVHGWIISQCSDGSWPEWNYDYHNGPTLPAIGHLERLVALSRAWKKEHSPQNKKILSAITDGLNFWRQRDPLCANWWFRDIGVPTQLVSILALTHEVLPPDLRAWAIERLSGGRGAGHEISVGLRLGADGKVEDEGTPATGQNLVWLRSFLLFKGCFCTDAGMVSCAVSDIRGELRVQPFGAEGIQADWSFHQHGSLLYTGGYGAPFAADLVRIAHLLNATPWAFSAAELEVLSQFLLVGHGWSLWGGWNDYGVLGRNNTRLPGKTLYLAHSCDLMAALVPHKSALFQQMAANQRAHSPSPGPARGNRHFFRSDWMVHRRDGFHASVRMVSDRVLATESGNGEGLHNYHVADGAFQWLQRGDEYLKIAPLWNWRQVPGVTAAQRTDSVPRFEWGKGARGLTAWAVGASDGENGCAAFLSLRDGVTAWKSWFFVGDVVVCLGAGIQSDSDFPVLTTIEQSASRGSAHIKWQGGRREELREGAVSGATPHWIWHDEKAMLFPCGGTIQVARETRRGDWHSINRTLASRVVENQVFSVVLPHGTAPRNAEYAYILLSAPSPSQIETLAARLAPEIVCNSLQVQAVRVSGKSQWLIAFHRAGGLDLEEGVRIEAAQSAVLLLEKTTQGWRFNAAHPEPGQKEMRFLLKLVDWGTEKVVLQCNPTPELSGQTVEICLPAWPRNINPLVNGPFFQRGRRIRTEVGLGGATLKTLRQAGQ